MRAGQHGWASAIAFGGAVNEFDRTVDDAAWCDLQRSRPAGDRTAPTGIDRRFGEPSRSHEIRPGILDPLRPVHGLEQLPVRHQGGQLPGGNRRRRDPTHRLSRVSQRASFHRRRGARGRCSSTGPSARVGVRILAAGSGRSYCSGHDRVLEVGLQRCDNGRVRHLRHGCGRRDELMAESRFGATAPG
jgi:hypothetical protein